VQRPPRPQRCPASRHHGRGGGGRRLCPHFQPWGPRRPPPGRSCNERTSPASRRRRRCRPRRPRCRCCHRKSPPLHAPRPRRGPWRLCHGGRGPDQQTGGREDLRRAGGGPVIVLNPPSSGALGAW
ncbi:hypothetical protein T484DRAFT_1901261, partial [Baffinella frigidus]